MRQAAAMSQARVRTARDNPAARQSGGQFGDVTGVLCQHQCGIRWRADSNHMRISDPITAKACLMQDGPHQLAKPFVRGHHPDALTPVASRESRLGMTCTRHPAADLR